MQITKSVQDNHTDKFLNSFNADDMIIGSSILDVGCGHGYASAEFLKRGARLVDALDIDLRKVNDIPKPIYLQDIPVEFFSSWEEILSKNTKYDIIWHHHVIEHVENCFEFLRTIHSLLNDGGHMWMACPNMASHSVFSPGHIHNFQAGQLIDVLRRCGFAVAEARVWALAGQLRVRVPKNGDNDYPEIMKTSLTETGRCPADILSNWRWKEA